MFPGVGMKQLIPKLTVQLQQFYDIASQIPVPLFDNVVPQGVSDAITHEWLWPRVGQFFKLNDVILAETGMSHSTLLIILFPLTSTSTDL